MSSAFWGAARVDQTPIYKMKVHIGAAAAAIRPVAAINEATLVVFTMRIFA